MFRFISSLKLNPMSGDITLNPELTILTKNVREYNVRVLASRYDTFLILLKAIKLGPIDSLETLITISSFSVII